MMAFRTDASPAEILASGAQLLESYAAYRIARGSPASLTALAVQGRYWSAMPQASFLELLGGPVDVRSLAAVPPAWTLDEEGRAVGVVHFYAPIKSEWRDALQARNVEILRYLPQDAFIVRGPPSTIESCSSLPFVDWVGSYDPAWKVRSDPPAVGLQDVRIVVFPGESPEAIEAWLAHHGVPAGPEGIDGAFGSGDFRWVRTRVPGDLIPSLAALPSVEFIDPVVPVHLLNAQTDWVIQTNRTFPNGTGDYRYWRYGLDARGQVIGMADTGLDYDNAEFRQAPGTIVLGDIYNTTDMARRKVVRYLNMGVLTGQITWPGGGGTWDPWSIQDSTHQPAAGDCTFGHGTAVASTLAGNDNGLGLSPNDGNALAAVLYVEDIGTVGPNPTACSGNTDLLNYIPENYADLFGPAGLVYNDPIAPVRIQSDSWGGTGNVYDVQARMVDAFVWAHPDMTILFAAGNAGSSPGTVGTPATAKDIVAVGGAYNPDTGLGEAQNDLASQSGRGPALDGRIKPTIVTIFDGDSAMSDGNPLSNTPAADAHWAGTSYATPAAAAAAAIVRQYFIDGWYPAGRPVAADSMTPSAALIRAMLIASGAQVTGTGTVARSSSDTWPNNEQGFGRILLSNVLPIAAAGDTFRTQVVDGTAGLLTGDQAVYTFHVGVAGNVRFVLTWSDYPGALGAAKALVNDLDLEVTAPDGTVYRGNHFAPFAQGQSLAGGTFDTTNVEEAVLVKNAMAGDWSVRIIGANVPVGPQPFALVATGRLDGSYGRVILDRPAYSEADTIRISVEDSDATSVVVHAMSSVEPTGEDVVLTSAGADGMWRGTIPTAFGSASPDGVLQVREGDTVTLVYQDLSPPHAATVQARILASGPTLHDVRVTDLAATSATVRWRTDEPATSEVQYGTSPSSLTSSSNSSELRADHAVPLTGLASDTLYYFAAVSRGRRGNATIDANVGLFYSFLTPPMGDVLLVVGGNSFPPEREASYAVALGGNGWTWSVWRVADDGLPPLSILQARRVVIWQVGLEQYPPFNATARALVKSYLDGGGRLLVSSHDTAWALGDVSSSPFASPQSRAWLGGVLKARFVCDPSTIAGANGIASDPISGAYTSGVPYTPHRSGGADDQIGTNSAGGTAAVVWTDGTAVQGCSNNQPIGLRWVSASSNGTVGTGAWGGTRSRLVYFAYELTGLDTTSTTNLNPNSSTRAVVLDAALRWLVSTATSTLDRDHPDVRILSPIGGTFSGPTIAINWTANAYGTGIGIANLTLAVSPDAGQTWTTLATLPGSATTYTWTLDPTANGNRYRLSIVARDNGTPSLSGEDRSAVTFAINRPGGDAEGPVLWAGSVRVAPRPPGAGALTSFTAVADDRARGGSVIAAAELFLGVSLPSGLNGTGLVMTATDGAFDATFENVSWQGGLATPPGVSCGWIHAKDAAGNWGPYSAVCFVVILVGPDTVPPGPAGVDRLRVANAGNDLSIAWLPAWDEGLYGGTTEYHVWRATSPRGTYVDVSGPILANASARYTYVDPGRAADAPDYFYRVGTVDAANNSALSTTLAAKTHILFLAGLNLLGMPIDLTDPGFGTLAAGRAWADAWTYDACAGGIGWASALPSEPVTFPLPAGRGFWINGTGSDFVLALGLVPQTSQIHLCTGWNLVALPGFASGLTVHDVKAATGADAVTGFDPAGPYHVRDLLDSAAIVSGRGYWVHVPTNATWTVAGW